MSASHVKIIKGVYGKREITNEIWPLAKLFVLKSECGAGYITVHGSKVRGLEDRQCRIKVESEASFVYLNDDHEPVAVTIQEDPKYTPADTPKVVDHVEEYKSMETDEEAMERIARTFEILNELTSASAKGIVRGMVVSGAPGIGKSFGVERTLQRINAPAKLANKQEKFEIIRGAATPIGLYKTLYLNRSKGYVTVLDDCDSVLYDETSLNLLKAALDSGNTRRLHWLAESRALKAEDIPTSFEFEGSVIFLTNIDFRRSTAGKIKEHLNAIMSRCHYLDLELSTTRDQLLRIQQIVNAGMLNKYHFQDHEQEEVVNFVLDNHEELLELSLRMVLKIADLRAAMPEKWEELASATCIKPEDKYKRLIRMRR